MMRDNVRADARESGGDGGQDLLGVGMDAAERLHHRGWRMLRIDQCGGLLEFVAQPRHLLDADLFELIERNIDHVGVVEHPPIRVGADRVVARRLRHQIALEPLRSPRIAATRFAFALANACLSGPSATLAKASGTSLLKNPIVAGICCSAISTINLRRKRGFRLLPRRVEICGAPQSRGQLPNASDFSVGANSRLIRLFTADVGKYILGIALVAADLFSPQQFAVRVRQQPFAIRFVGGRQRLVGSWAPNSASHFFA